MKKQSFSTAKLNSCPPIHESVENSASIIFDFSFAHSYPTSFVSILNGHVHFLSVCCLLFNFLVVLPSVISEGFQASGKQSPIPIIIPEWDRRGFGEVINLDRWHDPPFLLYTLQSKARGDEITS